MKCLLNEENIQNRRKNLLGIQKHGLVLYPNVNPYEGSERQRIFREVVSLLERVVLKKYPELKKIVGSTSKRFNHYQIEEEIFGIDLDYGDFRCPRLVLGYKGKIIAKFSFKSWQSGKFTINCNTPYETTRFIETDDCLKITKLLSQLVYIPDSWSHVTYTYYADNFYAEVFRSKGEPGCIIFGNEKKSLRFKYKGNL